MKFQIFFMIGLIIATCTAEEEGKIVGGEEVTIQQYPYQISLQYNKQHFCGGTVYNNNYIVTAAHCIYDFQGNTNYLTIVAGQTRISDSNGQRIAIAQLIAHPDYKASNSDYDVGLLKLATPLEFNDNVQPLALTTTGVSARNTVVVTGWGTTRRGGGGDVSDTLKATKVRVQSRVSCQLQYFLSLTKRMFCAGNIIGGSDSCQGDSGGPVNYNNSLAGIVSFGRGCANILSPGVYTNVLTVRDFIVNNTH